ncbi:cell wall-binding repeat-containing protein [Herbiconiux sp. KACC 21604]|uniref:cell wall-binding repeat-containing protein n=1 Tax=unclassified Herbiconiux TaxID=2618217 RepID=UPI0014910E87|nr:cell wall-binding repeat-containing protein [Herbiconiux sp. SALV-R1]QJU55380.1 hypothetical protein HL652_18305 [Herbiconiux sp. SALV-R1]WPO86553.1 cell wall-binding repeat-containing protein [Herbiconiux sp. KACC 21604]
MLKPASGGTALVRRPSSVAVMMAAIALVTSSTIGIGTAAAARAAEAPGGTEHATEPLNSEADESVARLGPIDPGSRVAEFPLPDSASLPSDLEAGPDGTVWVALFGLRQVVRVAISGEVVETVSLNSAPTQFSPDGTGGVWVTEISGRLTHVMSGKAAVEYTVPTVGAGLAETAVLGDYVFFAEADAQQLGRLDWRTGEIKEFPIPGAVSPWGVGAFGDAVWVTDSGCDTIWAFGADGKLRQSFTGQTGLRGVQLIKPEVGDVVAGRILRETRIDSFTLSPDGRLHTKSLTGENGDLTGQVVRRDGGVWFVDREANTIVLSAVPAGASYSVPTRGTQLTGMALAGGRYLWSAERRSGRLVRLDTTVAIDADRIAGTDRFETAVAIARRGEATSSGSAFLVNGDKFPDALAVSAIANYTNTPILLTHAGALPDSTRRELTRMNPKSVTIVGGESSVSPAVEALVRSELPSTKVDRVSGADRYAVSRALVERYAAGAGRPLFVANASNFPDALSAGPAAGRLGGALLLIDGSKTVLTPEERSLVQKYGGTDVRIVGGRLSVRPEIEAALRGLTASITRYDGVDRYAVSTAVNASGVIPGGTPLVASGASFPDALAAASIANGWRTGLFLVHPDCIPDADLTLLAQAESPAIVVIGGEATLSKSVEEIASCP